MEEDYIIDYNENVKMRNIQKGDARPSVVLFLYFKKGSYNIATVIKVGVFV